MRYQELFEAEELQDELQLFVNQTESELGLQVFSLYMLRGDIKLISLIINKEDRKKGLGSEAMDRLTKFADQHGKRIILSPASKDDHHGTTSRSRLVKFYKRFGFYENKGKDFSISDSMIRDPKLMEEFPWVKAVRKRSKEKEMLKKHGPMWRRSVERLNKDLEDPYRILSKGVRRQITSVLYDKNRLAQELNEKVEMHGEIKVLITPTVDVLRRFIFGSAHGTVRGLFDGKKFYFWDADKLIHDHMAMELGLEFYSRLDLWRNKDGSFNIESLGGKGYVDGIERIVPEVKQHPYYLKLRREG